MPPDLNLRCDVPKSCQASQDQHMERTSSTICQMILIETSEITHSQKKREREILLPSASSNASMSQLRPPTAHFKLSVSVFQFASNKTVTLIIRLGMDSQNLGLLPVLENTDTNKTPNMTMSILLVCRLSQKDYQMDPVFSAGHLHE